MQPARIDLQGVTGVPASPVQPAPPQYWIADAELETPVLPRDHPTWMRDAVAISVQAQRWIARSRPLAMRVLGFWDHVGRAIRIAGRTLSVDPAGCYRID